MYQWYSYIHIHSILFTNFIDSLILDCVVAVFHVAPCVSGMLRAPIYWSVVATPTTITSTARTPTTISARTRSMMFSVSPRLPMSPRPPYWPARITHSECSRCPPPQISNRRKLSTLLLPIVLGFWSSVWGRGCWPSSLCSPQWTRWR